MDAGLLPVKALEAAKRRLSPHFDPAQRALIARALFEDALALCDATTWLEWWIVSSDGFVQSAAAERGLRVVHDPGTGLNAALRSAMRAIGDSGATSVTIVPADVPLATPEDLMDVRDTGTTSDVVVVPARRDGGTNGLYLRPPGLLEPRFGPGSLQAHAELADRLELRCSILPLPHLALDIDTIEDVDELLGSPRAAAGRAGALLSRLRSLPA
jgi:2-phospho-L-lactate/phosphoenolpyruvate guanylyltransferase